MNDPRLITIPEDTPLKPNQWYKVKPPMMCQAALSELAWFARENGLRFGQALSIALDEGPRPADLFFVGDKELAKRIKEFIANAKDSVQ